MAHLSAQEVIERLAARGLTMPGNPPPPAGCYEPFRLHRGTGYLAAQTSAGDASLMGRVGIELSTEQGVRAAERAALNAVARIGQALGGYERFRGLLHVAGHVASGEAFLEHPKVLDGASELFLHVFGDLGRHSRTAYPHIRLPMNLCIELEITFAYEE